MLSAGGPARARHRRTPKDDLRTARGLLLAVLIMLAFWAAVVCSVEWWMPAEWWLP